MSETKSFHGFVVGQRVKVKPDANFGGIDIWEEFEHDYFSGDIEAIDPQLEYYPFKVRTALHRSKYQWFGADELVPVGASSTPVSGQPAREPDTAAGGEEDEPL